MSCELAEQPDNGEGQPWRLQKGADPESEGKEMAPGLSSLLDCHWPAGVLSGPGENTEPQCSQ